MNEYDIEEAFAAIEEELIASMMRNMTRHKAEEDDEGIQWEMWQVKQLEALNEYKRKNQKQFSKQFSYINSQMEELIRTANADGQLDQEAEILKAIKSGFKGIKRNSNTMSAEFFKLNDRKLDALINATMNDMSKAETAILRMANDQYRKAIFNAQVYANTGAGTYEQAVDMATKDMLTSGLNCVEYSNGARHTLKDYADMAIRTASKRAYLQGEGVKRQEWGISTVIMNKRGNPCPKCLPFVGKVLVDDVWSGGRSDGVDPETGKKYPTMSYAISKGLYHPRCKDSHTTYFPGISTADDTWTEKELEDIGLQAKQEVKQQYAKRQAEKFERLAKYSLDEENQRAYASRRNMWEAQAYRAVSRGKNDVVEIKSNQKINIKQVTSYFGNVHISDNANIKPRALHDIYINTENALKRWEISSKPKIVIVSPDEMPTAYGKYDAINNIVYYIPQIADKEIVDNVGEIEFHEMWHMKQAENFRRKYGEITYENYLKYIEYSCNQAKKTIDEAGINKYNIGDISSYASKMYKRGRFDEVEAEYMVKNLRRR